MTSVAPIPGTVVEVLLSELLGGRVTVPVEATVCLPSDWLGLVFEESKTNVDKLQLLLGVSRLRLRPYIFILPVFCWEIAVFSTYQRGIAI
jgi:hypothetical protein